MAHLHSVFWVFFLLLIYLLTTSNVISGQVSTCKSAHLWRVNGAAVPLGGQLNWYHDPISRTLSQSHCPHTKLTSPSPILLMLGAWLGRDKYQFCESFNWLGWKSNLMIFRSGSHLLYRCGQRFQLTSLIFVEYEYLVKPYRIFMAYMVQSGIQLFM